MVFKLTKHCDALLLRKKYEKLLRIVPKNSKEKMTIDYCYILFWCGEYKESLSLLKIADIHRLENEKKFITQYLFYLFLYVQICIELGYYNESLSTLDTINSMIRINVIPESKIKQTKKDIAYLNHVINLKQGNGQEEVEYFSRKLKFATDNISKISYTYYYANALLLENKLDEATEQFQYVIDNGKSLHLVELAKSDMQQISTQLFE